MQRKSFPQDPQDPTILTITSFSNPRVKELRKLGECSHRKETSQFIVEGFSPLEMLVKVQRSILTLYFCPDLLTGYPERLALWHSLIRLSHSWVRLTEEIFKKVSYRENPEGLLAVVERYHLPIILPHPDQPCFFLVLEHIEKPGNLGAILRTADACACQGVILCEERVDLFNPNVIRASMGGIFTVPIDAMNRESLVSWLETHQIQPVIITPEGASPYLSFLPPSRTAFIFGTEHEGLSTFWRHFHSPRIYIPMYGKVNSLNLSNCVAIISYYFRQHYPYK